MSTNGQEIAKHFEGLRLKAYLCPAGYWTIGYGSIVGVKPGDQIDYAEAIRRFDRDWAVARCGARACCPGLSGNRLEALADFVFNLGVGRLRASTLRGKINAGEWQEVPQELRKWVWGGGRRLPGLVARREAEILLLKNV